MRWVILIGVGVVVGLWGWSMYAPDRFGTCERIVTRFADEPTVRECHPHGSASFVVPLVALAVFFVLFSDDDLVRIKVDPVSFERRRRGRDAASEIRQWDLDERAEALVAKVEATVTPANEGLTPAPSASSLESSTHPERAGPAQGEVTPSRSKRWFRRRG